METDPRGDLTLILGRARAGDEGARGDLIALVYDQLRQVAGRLMRRERADHTLSPTAVVHEAVIRLLGDAVFDRSPDRAYLFASAARAMRQVLIEHARRRDAGRRGGGRVRVPLDLVVDYFEGQGLDIVAVHEALDRLARRNERQAQVMTLRYFGGMSMAEVAASLEVSVVTVERDWRLARADARPAPGMGRMTPERWRRVEDLFDAALRIDPAERDRWLRASCEGDDDLRVELRRLLASDEQADREGFLEPPEADPPPPAPTTTWPPRSSGTGIPPAPGREDLNDDEPEARHGFSPRAAIAAGSEARPTAAPSSTIRARLREVPFIHALLLGMMLVWTHAVLGDDDPRIFWSVVVALPILSSLVALLSSRYPLSTARLRLIELGMTALFAGLVTLIQYRLMLAYSLRDDPMLAPLTMKNVVLYDCILILTYGLYVPKSWRRAALVAAPRALLPFVTLVVLIRQDPEAMGWLWRGWRKSETPRLLLFSFDAMILLIVAAGSAFGARTISRLRRQVVEARQLGQYRLGRRIGAGGMGEVYLAEHQLLKRPCALKLI